MQSATQTTPVSKKSLWVGLMISTLIVLFLLFDGGVKVIKVASAAEATVHVGYPARLVVPIGIAELICVALLCFRVPRSLVRSCSRAILVARPLPKSGWKIHGSSFPLLSACSFGVGFFCVMSGCAHLFCLEVSRPTK